jgi:hypothetical protein
MNETVLLGQFGSARQFDCDQTRFDRDQTGPYGGHEYLPGKTGPYPGLEGRVPGLMLVRIVRHGWILLPQGGDEPEIEFMDIPADPTTRLLCPAEFTG